MPQHNSKRNSVPDRWEDYLPIGKRLIGTRFITFKVPLKKSLCKKLENAEEFSPSSLLELSEEGTVSLGLVIDLTNTKRYYNPEDFIDRGVEYQKIFTEGHVVPSSNVIMRFAAVVDDFVERNPENEKLIGVHCTHGVNRTGYLVCRYMVDKLDIEPEEALKIYEESRGYAVERENYLADLRNGVKIEKQAYEDYKAANPVKPYDPFDQSNQKPRDQFYHGNVRGPFEGQGPSSRHDHRNESRSNQSRLKTEGEHGPPGSRDHRNKFERSAERHSRHMPNRAPYDARNRSRHRNYGPGYHSNPSNDGYGSFGYRRNQDFGRYHNDFVYDSYQGSNYVDFEQYHPSNDGYGNYGRHYQNDYRNNRRGASNYGSYGHSHSNDDYGSYGHNHSNDDCGNYGRRHEGTKNSDRSTRKRQNSSRMNALDESSAPKSYKLRSRTSSQND